jgi:chromodomain-helicase-DNA-binding protein 1
VKKRQGQGQGVNRTHSSLVNQDVDATSSDKEFDMNMDVQYQSEGELNDTNRLQNEGAADDNVNMRASNLQPSGRRTGIAGKWGSTFWKDCQPMTRGGSDSGQDSKSGSDYRNVEGSEDNSLDGREDRLESEDDNRKKDVGKGQRGHSDVPADEMLSDEYYEQDGDEQRDTMHYRGFQHSIGLNSRPQSKPVANSSHVKRNPRVLNDNEDGDNDDKDADADADADYEEEDEEDGSLFLFLFCLLDGCYSITILTVGSQLTSCLFLVACRG